MKQILFLFVLFIVSQNEYAQPTVVLNDSISLEVDRFVGKDTFGSLYFIQENILYKKWNNQQWQYGDFILGDITSVSILNPLKILLFYESTNTIVFIDKYFNEIDRVDFNTLPDFKNVSQVSQANDTEIWIFDNNTQQLEIFDTTARKSIAMTQPIASIPDFQVGNFNFCWLVTPTFLYEFNIYGSLTYKFSNENYAAIQIYRDGIIVQKENKLYHWNPKTQVFKEIILPEITIKQFYVTNEILYIYDLKTIYSFNLTPPKN